MAPTLAAPPSLSETLDILPQVDGSVAFRFEFASTTPAPATSAAAGAASNGVNSTGDASNRHFDLFPRTLGRIVDEHGVDELCISFTQGRWNHAQWDDSHAPTAPSGVHFWAWFRRHHHGLTVDQRWRALTHALSGLFCSSLNFIDETVTSAPMRTFRYSGHDPNGTMAVRYGSLPREAVCTENLTPWAKLLPCQKKSGLATLLNAYKLFDSKYTSIALDMRTLCHSPGHCTRHLSQTVTAVMDPTRSGGGKRGFSLQSVMSASVQGACPIAAKSRVRVRGPAGLMEKYQLEPASFVTVQDSKHDETIHAFNLKKDHHSTPLDIKMSRLPPAGQAGTGLFTPPVVFTRHLTGFGQDKGGIEVKITNQSPQRTSVEAVYFDMIPWYIRPLLHTLDIRLSSGTPVVPTKFTLQPALDRRRPSVLEITLAVPYGETVAVTFQFYKAFLRYTEHRPDANRGFDIGSGMLTVLDANSSSVASLASGSAATAGSSSSPSLSSPTPRRLYGDNILVQLPTPDFSMPYNVITFTSTIIAFFFGSLFNSINRAMVAVKTSRQPTTAQ
ncbi:Subunit of the glycosylphosphatidylinositol transamidase complex-like protein [Sorochytrium milnesiophthora]